VYGMKEMDLRTPLAFLGRVTLASGGMGLALLVASASWNTPSTLVLSAWERGLSLLPLAALALAGGLVYALLLRLLGGLDDAERRRLLEMQLPFRPLLARLL